MASLFNPFIGLLIYICFAIVRPESLWHWSVPAGNYSRIIALSLLVGWAVNGFGNWNVGRARAVLWALLGYMGWMVLSAIQAVDADVAWNACEAAAKIVLPFAVGVTIIDSFDKVKALAWVIMISQGYVAYEMNLTYYSGFNRIRELGFGGMDNNCNAIAMVCGAGFAFFLGLAEHKTWRRWMCFLAAALMAHCIMIADSRGGMLALIVTGIVSFLILPKRPIYFAYLLLAVAVGLRLAGPAVWERFETSFASEEERDYSADSRLQLWTACLDIIAKQPLLGIGPHQFPQVAPEYGFSKGKEAHSTWMQLGAEGGVPCLALLLGFYLIAMWRLWLLSRQLLPIDPLRAMSCQMVIASLTGFMVAAQFVTLVGLEIPYYVTLVGAGLLMTSNAEVVDAAEWDEEADYSDRLARHGAPALT